MAALRRRVDAARDESLIEQARDRSPGATTAADRLIVFGNAWPHHAAARSHQDQEEGAQQLGEQPPPFLGRILKIRVRRSRRSCAFSAAPLDGEVANRQCLLERVRSAGC